VGPATYVTVAAAGCTVAVIRLTAKATACGPGVRAVYVLPSTGSSMVCRRRGGTFGRGAAGTTQVTLVVS